MKNDPIHEDALTHEEVGRIHKFGECWIRDYSRYERHAWERALWLFAWERGVVWNDIRRTVPFGVLHPIDRP
jgi:hypothetical protein